MQILTIAFRTFGALQYNDDVIECDKGDDYDKNAITAGADFGEGQREGIHNIRKARDNLSVVINILIKQIIITEGIPFEVKMSHPIYSAEEAVNKVLWLATTIFLIGG